MRARRSTLVSFALGACLAAGFALIGPLSSHAGPTPATASSARALVTENVLLAMPVGRIARDWADRHVDDRHAKAGTDAVLAFVVGLAVLAGGVVLVVQSTGASAYRRALVPARGPPRFELA